MKNIKPEDFIHRLVIKDDYQDYKLLTIEEGLDVINNSNCNKEDLANYITEQRLEYELCLYYEQPTDIDDIKSKNAIYQYSERIKEFSYLELMIVNDMERYQIGEKHPFDMPYNGTNDYIRMSTKQFWIALEARKNRTLSLFNELNQIEYSHLKTEVKVYLNNLEETLNKTKAGIINDFKTKIFKINRSNIKQSFEDIFRDKANAKEIKHIFKIKGYTDNEYNWIGLNKNKTELLAAYYSLKERETNTILKPGQKTTQARIFYNEFNLKVGKDKLKTDDYILDRNFTTPPSQADINIFNTLFDKLE